MSPLMRSYSVCRLLPGAALALAVPLVELPAQRGARRAIIRLDTLSSAASGAARGARVVRVTATRADTLRRGVDTASVAAGELLVTTRTEGAPTLDRSGPIPGHYDLPSRIIAPTAAGSVASLALAVETTGLWYSPVEDVFVGVVQVGLDDSLHRAASIPLATPVRVALLAAGAEVTPAEVVLDHTNLPFAQVKVLAPAGRAEKILLRVRPTFSRGQDFNVAVHRPELKVSVKPARISGWGLETSSLMIGVPLVAPAGEHALTVGALLGAPVPGQLSVKRGGTAAITVRSKGIGVDSIRLTGDPFADAYAVVEYRYPSSFLVAAALGGGLGGVLRSLGRRRDRRLVAWARDLPWRVVAGVIAGGIIAVLYALGVNLTGLALPPEIGEATTFAAAAVGAYNFNKIQFGAPATAGAARG